MNKAEPSQPPEERQTPGQALPPDSNATSYSIGQAAMLACLLEATAPKVGNVHRSADFDDTTFYDFVLSAVAIEKVFDLADSYSLGTLILESVRATQASVAANTNLGIVLLLAPLAKCRELRSESVQAVLAESQADDRRKLYAAIGIAQPGGMGTVADADLQQPADETDNYSLVEAMSLAAERDSIALQYANGFREFFDFVLPTMKSSLRDIHALPDAIIAAHLKIMTEIPDTLIARKCGMEVAEQCSARAGKILDQYKIGTPDYYSALHELDFWLRGDGNRRNPGTSADFVAAGLFACLRSGELTRDSIRQGLTAARFTSPDNRQLQKQQN